MKKFIAVATGAVLAASVCVFAACNDSKDVTKYKYKEVDLSQSQAKAEFVDELVEKVDFENIVGDTSAKDFKLGLAAEAGVKIDINASAKDAMLPGAESAVDLQAALSYEMNSSAKLKYSADERAAESETRIAGSLNASDELFALLGELAKLDEATVTAIKTATSKFDYTTKTYFDSDYVYMQIPTEILQALPEDIRGELPIPDSGKFKTSIGGSADKGYALNAATAFASRSAAPSSGADNKELIRSYATIAVEYLSLYNVKVEVSKQNGYAVKLSADSEVIFNAVKGLIPDSSEAFEMIGEYATFNSLNVALYFAVDKDGAFKQLSLNVDADADLSLNLADLIEEGLPTVSGSAKISVNLSLKKYSGKINVPANDPSYVDMNSFHDDSQN